MIAQAKKTNDYTEWLQYNWKMKHFIKKKSSQKKIKRKENKIKAKEYEKLQ